MDHPHDGVELSVSHAGDVPEKPDRVVGVVVSDEDNEPAGILEFWDDEAWIYADTDVLEDLN